MQAALHGRLWDQTNPTVTPCSQQRTWADKDRRSPSTVFSVAKN
jgi:hypothetical protein